MADQLNSIEAPKSKMPEWASSLGRKWNSGCHSVVTISGNIHDLFPSIKTGAYVPLKTFLFEGQFSQRRFFMFYDISEGLRFATKEMKAQFYEWLNNFDTIEKTEFSSKGLPLEFFKLSVVLRQFFVWAHQTATAETGSGVTMVIEYPEKIFPSSENNADSFDDKAATVSLLKMAASDELKRMDIGVFLVSESLKKLPQDIIKNPNIAHVTIGMPDEKERFAFISSDSVCSRVGKETERYSLLSQNELAKHTSGLNLVRIMTLLSEAAHNNEQITFDYVASKKKSMIEEFCHGLVKFKSPDPKMNLDRVANHEAAKKKLRSMVSLIKSGKGHLIDKGVLVPGRVGVGKSFLIECFASECGLPVMELGNFRSKWVGDTEEQLDKILMTIKSLGPVVVAIDEADAVLGNRTSDGDSGVSTRVFAALAAHIGDAKMRGRELWIAMTSRPDLMAVDMKRQGRFGLCLPLFPSSTSDEVTTMMKIVAKQDGVELTDEDCAFPMEPFTDESNKINITGSDIESIVKRSLELAAELNEPVKKEHVKEVVVNFVNPLDPNLLALQDIAAILACSDTRYLPERYRSISKEERKKLVGVLEELKKRK